MSSIKEQCDELRSKLRKEADDLKRSAGTSGICAWDQKPIPAMRLNRGSYTCDEKCYGLFQEKYGWSTIEEQVKAKRRELKESQPKKEVQAWTHPVARKEHQCEVCSLTISKGVKYDRFTRLPDDEYFEDEPYESHSFHVNCQKLVGLLFEKNWFDYEGYGDDDVSYIIKGLTRVLDIPENETRERIRDDRIGEPELKLLEEKYGSIEGIESELWEEEAGHVVSE